MSVPAAQLSCQQCQRRKTKCSRTVPCSACLRAGINCTAVQRHRLPRGRSGRQRPGADSGKALQDRIERLEAVVSQLQHNGSSEQASFATTEQDGTGPPVAAHTPVEAFVAPAFWTELSDAVAGLRDVLEYPDKAEEVEVADNESVTPAGTDSRRSPRPGDTNAVLFGATVSLPSGPSTLPSWLQDRLLSVYEDRVHAIFKPLHWPSTLSTIRSNYPGLQDTSLSTEATALQSAIYFTAACTLFDHELDGRQSWVKELRQNTEEAFVRAELLTTTKLIVLQAFVVYLAGLRACQANAQQWTLTATAIRIANAQGISARSSRLLSPFDAEVQRRTWFCIGVLDLQSAFDRGSQPLLKSDDFQSWPLNVNDDEMSPQFMPSPASKQGSHWTEMSLSLMIYRAGICQRRLTELGSSATSVDGMVDPRAAGREQVAVLADFERRTELLSNLCDALPCPIRRFTMAVAKESLVAMRLLLHRPLHRRDNGLVHIEDESTANIDLLSTSTEVLERSQMKRTQYEFARWAWFSWVKWYALAVVLAELCTARGPQADHAWEVAQRSYDDYEKAVADSKAGLLWRPIAKLMRKVKAVRETIPTEHRVASSALPYPHNVSCVPGSDMMETVYTTSETEAWPISSNFAFDQSNGLSQDVYDSLSVGETRGVDDTWIHWDLLLNDFNDINTNIYDGLY